MHLVLDTNILHQENLSSANMKTLLRLVESGYVTVCIPDLVRREYVTKIISECTAKLQAASSHLENVGRIARISSLYSRVNEVQRELIQIKSEVADAYEADFTRWSETYRVQELPFESGMIGAVLNDYFEGATPYRNPKSREDILDSMIGKSVDALIGLAGDVGVVVKDGTFKRHWEQQGRAKVFASIEDFLLLEQTKAELNRLDIEANIRTLMATLVDAKEALGEFAKGSQSLLNTIYLEEDEVTGVEALDMDCFGVHVNGPEVGDVTSLQLDQFEYLGKGQFAVAFAMDARARVDYCASYGDYLEHEREESIVMTSMNGVGICDLEEIRPVRIAGKLIINIGKEGDVDTAQAAIATGVFRDESLEFEAASATLLSP
jgi:hypothetical protein